MLKILGKSEKSAKWSKQLLTFSDVQSIVGKSEKSAYLNEQKLSPKMKILVVKFKEHIVGPELNLND